MNKTKIEWTDYTWNPITGCLGPDGQHRCSYCYANREARGRLRHRYLANNFLAPISDPQDPFSPRFWMDRLYEPCHVKKPSRIFAVDMGELFGYWIPEEWQNLVFSVIEACPQHTFQLLTKQPQNLLKFSPYPPNCWVGATATEPISAGLATYYLKHVQASVRFISFEPLLRPVKDVQWDVLGWLIIGAQTGPGAIAPRNQWVDDLIAAARYYSIPIFLKDNLKWHQRIQQFPEPKGVKV